MVLAALQLFAAPSLGVHPGMNPMKYEPGLHKPVPMGVRVKVKAPYVAGEAWGEVVGIAAVHVIFTYIILLDNPIESVYGTVRAICVGGPELEGENGENWRLEETG